MHILYKLAKFHSVLAGGYLGTACQTCTNVRMFTDWRFIMAEISGLRAHNRKCLGAQDTENISISGDERPVSTNHALSNICHEMQGTFGEISCVAICRTESRIIARKRSPNPP